MGSLRFSAAGALAIQVLVAGAAGAQPKPAAPPAAAAEQVKDPLGRETPRGTVLGFINVARRGEDDAARQYLNTTLPEKAAVELAHKLFVVLDSRLPARLNDLSDRPEGAVPNVLKPHQDVVGTIVTANGPLKIVVERVTQGSSPPVWLFARETLDAIPEVYGEIDLISVERHLPGFLAKPRVAGVRIFEWIAFVLAIPLCYRVVGWLGRLLGVGWAAARRRRPDAGAPGDLLPGPVRILVIAIAIRWLLTRLDLPFVERQFWTGVSVMLVTAAVI